MPITKDGSEIRVQGGSNSRFVFGEQTNYSDETVGSNLEARVSALGGGVSGGTIYKYVPKIRNLDFKYQGTPVPTTSLDGYDDDTSMMPPALDVQGSMETLVTVDGLAAFLAGITQDLSPDETAISGNTGTVPSTSIPLGTSGNATTLAISAADRGIKLVFTPTGAIIDQAEGGGSAGATITGQNAAGDPIQETISWFGTATDAQTTINYYATGDVVITPAGFSAGSLAATAAGTGGMKVRFDFNNGTLRRYKTAEVSIGEIPSQFFGLVETNMTLTAERTTALRAAFNFIGRKGRTYSAFGSPANQTNPTRSVLPSSIIEPPETVYSGYEIALLYAGKRIPLQSFNLNVNQNIDFTHSMMQSADQLTAPTKDDKRSIGLGYRTLYALGNNLDEDFQQATPYRNIALEARANVAGQGTQAFRFVGYHGQIDTSPGGAVSGFGQVEQDVNLMFKRPPGQTSPGYFEIETQYYDRVRQYT